MTIIIRPLQQHDQENWRILWDAYLATFKMFMPTAVTDTVWERLMDPGNPLQGLAGFNASGMVAIAQYLLHPVTWSVDDRCFLMDLFVAPETRRQGIGRRLLEAVYAAADRAGGGYVYWFAFASNTEACGFYEKIAQRHGYILFERHRNTNSGAT